MNALKSLAIILLSFLLFLSLFVFGIAFTVNSTVLNPDFVADEVDNINVSALVRELTEEQVNELLATQVEFLKETINDEVDKIGIPSILREPVKEQLNELLAELSESLPETIYAVIADQEPWLKAQARVAIYAGYDFLFENTDSLSLVIPLEPLKEDLRDSLWQTFQQSLPSELFGLIPALLEPYFNEFYQEFTVFIPSEFELNESFIPPEAMTQIILIRQGINYFQVGYNLLIGFIVLLILGIILINRKIRSTTRELGVNFLIYGVLMYAGIFLAGYWIPVQLPLAMIPSSLQMWVLQLANDILAPLKIFSLGLLAGGAVLIAISFVLNLRHAEEGS